MTEYISFNIWFVSAAIFAIVVLSKLLAKETATVDVLWLIIFGAFFANIGLIPTHHEVLEEIGEWGIVFVMFALGFEEDLDHFKEGLKHSWGIALIGAIFPFGAGYFSAKLFGYNNGAAMLWGLTMTATAVSLTMMCLRNENLHKSTAATGIMTAAVIDDILSLIGVAMVVPIVLMAYNPATSSIGIDFTNILWILLKVVLFFTILILMGIFAFPERVPQKLPKESTWLQKTDYYLTKLFVSVNIKKLLLAFQGEFTPLMMIFIAMTAGALAYYFGFHPAIGAYMAGLFLREDYFIFHQAEAKQPNKHFIINKKIIDHIAFSIFGPIFFVNLGSKLIFDIDIFWQVLPLFLTLFVLVFIFQILSATLAARFTGKYEWYQSIMIGFGMLGRAELAFIVIDIAYTENHIIDTAQFYVMIFTIFLLNITVPLTISWWKPYYLGEKKLTLFGIKLSK
jgi:Kef-type K+ transport system membrane component KefB